MGPTPSYNHSASKFPVVKMKDKTEGAESGKDEAQGVHDVRPKEQKPSRKKPHPHCIAKCAKPVNDDMIQCDGGCMPEWFHYECVELVAEDIPEGDWLCPKCLKAGRNRRSINPQMDELHHNWHSSYGKWKC